MSRIVRREVRKRGFFGWVFLLVFLGFNGLMLLWLGTYWANIAPLVNEGSEAAKAGGAIGGAIGTGMIMTLWLIGALITGLLALLTRGGKTVVEEYD
jgi:hypothetical protein